MLLRAAWLRRDHWTSIIFLKIELAPELVIRVVSLCIAHQPPLTYLYRHLSVNGHFANMGLFSFCRESVSIPKNPRTDKPVGYAFVDLSTPSEAERAISELSGKEILERKVSVQLARKPESNADKNEAGEGSGGEGSRRRPSGRGRGRGRGRGGRSGRGGRAAVS